MSDNLKRIAVLLAAAEFDDDPVRRAIYRQQAKDLVRKLRADGIDLDAAGPDGRRLEDLRALERDKARAARDQRRAAEAEKARILMDAEEAERRRRAALDAAARAERLPGDVLRAIRATTPFGPLNDIAATQDWTVDRHSPVRAYFMACLSELTYLAIDHRELDRKGRYKLVPSEAFQQLAMHRIFLPPQRPLDAPEPVVLNHGATTSTIHVHASLTVVAIRGTSAASDWLTNFNAPLVSVGGAAVGRAHRGFLEEARTALPLLLDHVPRDRPVYFTGHSLGGAVAALCKLLWPASAAPTRRPYLFASPRYGDEAARKRVGAFAYVKRNDIVPLVPPKALGYADAAAPLTVLGASPQQAPVIDILKDWTSLVATRPFAVQHDIGRYRYLVGRLIGGGFPAEAYAEAVRRVVLAKP